MPAVKNLLFTKKILILSLVVGLFLLFNLIRLIYLNIANEQRISARKNEVLALRLEVDNLEKQKIYYESDQYLESQARDKLQLARSSETIVVVPENLQKEFVEIETQKILGAASEKTSNITQWLELFQGNVQIKKFTFDF